MAKAEPVKDGLEITETAEGFQVTQPYQVTGLPVNKSRPLSDAAFVTGLPKFGDPYGLWDIKVVSRKWSAGEIVNGAICDIEYGTPDESQVAKGATSASPGRIEIRASTVTEQSYFDIKGDPLIVQYRGVATNGALWTLVNQAETQRPVFRFAHVRKEVDVPMLKAKNYVGRINLAPIWGFGAKELLILSITNQEQNKGLTQEVTYDFAWDPNTWRFESSTLVGGRLPSDATLGNGFEFYDVLEAKDFSPLGLNIRLT